MSEQLNLLPFGTMCPKCNFVPKLHATPEGVHAEVTYNKETITHLTEELPETVEFLHIRCLHCGFGYNTQCADRFPNKSET
jgi:hypothetical protein